MGKICKAFSLGATLIFTNLLFDVTGRAILAPKKSYVDEVNEVALSMMQGELFVFESADSVRTSENETEAALFPTEYLNSIAASGLPPPH